MKDLNIIFGKFKQQFLKTHNLDRFLDIFNNDVFKILNILSDSFFLLSQNDFMLLNYMIEVLFPVF